MFVRRGRQNQHKMLKIDNSAHKEDTEVVEGVLAANGTGICAWL